MVWNRRAEFQVIESVQYYFNKIDVIKMPDYLPDKVKMTLFPHAILNGYNSLLPRSPPLISSGRHFVLPRAHVRYRDGAVPHRRHRLRDVRRRRAGTASPHSTMVIIIAPRHFHRFSPPSIEFSFPLACQRNERKKWIHCFEGVTAVIFVAAISEYDQKLFEDASTNRMIEALDLFEDICNNAFFVKSSLILFLNKRDLFEEKMKTKNIRDYFTDFDGPDQDYEAGCKYFVGKFMAKNKTPDRTIYHHITCATDTRNVKVVFDACKDIILRENLKQSGFMD